MTSLERFGFTPTESRVYATLLSLGSSTGYAVSKAAGLARANTYQALDGLVRRGAARRAASIPARYAALPPDQVVESLERGFRKDLETLHQALRALPQGKGHDAGRLVVHDDWGAFEAAVARAIGQAREEVLAVAGPWAPKVWEAIAAARARGVTLRALSLGEPAPAGIHVRAVPDDDLTAYWSGRPVAVVLDRAVGCCGTELGGQGSGIETSHPALVPFLRHLLRRELATETARHP